MMWYYMKRGSVRVRDTVSDEQLRNMARAGDIDETDLLWSEQTAGRWVRAGSIPDLFVREAPAPVAPEPKAQPQDQPPEPVAEKGHHHKSAIAAVIVAVAAIAGVIAVNHFKKGMLPPPTPPPPQTPPPAPVETNEWETVEADVASLIKRGMVSDAQEVIAAYVSDKGEDTISAGMRKAVDTHMKRQRLTELYADFIKGKANAEQKKALIDISRELGELDNLKASLKSTLTGKKLPSEGLCRSILDFSKTLADESLRITSIETLAKIIKASSSERGCMEMVKLYEAEKMTDRATEQLRTFAAAHPNATNAWFELSARLAASGEKDEAMEALKEAIRLGGKEAKIDAKRDPRFESIKGAGFWWLTK
jgi:hypothetical protein